MQQVQNIFFLRTGFANLIGCNFEEFLANWLHFSKPVGSSQLGSSQLKIILGLE